MNSNYTKPEVLEKLSFLWSEVRLVIAAVALFLGGVPVLQAILPNAYASSGIVIIILKSTWIISGIASGYLLYRYLSGSKILFGGKDALSVTAFLVSVVSGINLGITGLFGKNIGMGFASGQLVFGVVALIYIATAYHLYRRWKESGEKVF